MDMSMYNWFTLLFPWNELKIVSQLYSNNIFKKIIKFEIHAQPQQQRGQFRSKEMG